VLAPGRHRAPAGRPAEPVITRRGGRGDQWERDADTIAVRAVSPSAWLAPATGPAPDLSQVRVHDDLAAARSARAVGAAAYSLGDHIVSAHRLATSAGPGPTWLLAHEVAHTLQARPPAIARAVTADYATIESNLSYALVDWAITDAEVHEVLVILNGLSAGDFADTIARMSADGFVNRLFDNMTEADQTTFAPLIARIHRVRSGTTTARLIEQLLSYGIVDWAITDAEAHVALTALTSLQGDPDLLKVVVSRIPAEQYERFYENLSDRDRADNLRFLQQVEVIRSSGMTIEELSDRQRTHLESDASAAGKSVGAHIRDEAAKRGYGGNPVTWWPGLLPAQKAAWIARFDAVVARLRTEPPEEIRVILVRAEAAGGGIRWKPERTQELGAYAYNDGGERLGVGRDWLERAERDLANVYDNIAHELGGHQEYGRPASRDIMEGALARLDPAERAIAISGPRSVYSAYSYMETEIYAELREFAYRRPDSGGDDPETSGVEEELRKIKDAFAPSVAESIVRSLRRRVQIDARITDAARDLLDRKIRIVFPVLRFP
jgi:hypothetical protein